MSDICDIRDIRYISSLNRIGDDCFRLILQYTQIQTMVRASLISQRSYLATDYIATKYLPRFRLNLCQGYIQPRILTIIPQLRLDGYDQFSTIQFSKYLRTLDLSHNNLDAEGIKVLVPHLTHCPRLQTLDLGCNLLGLEGMKVLSPHFASIPQLKFLDVSFNDLGAEGMSILIQGLALCPQLQILHLVGNDLSDDEMEVLTPHLASLRDKMRRNRLGTEAMNVLVSHLTSIN